MTLVLRLVSCLFPPYHALTRNAFTRFSYPTRQRRNKGGYIMALSMLTFALSTKVHRFFPHLRLPC